MAALAGLLQQRGNAVTGSDEHVYPPMSDHLAALAIPVTVGYAPENIPAGADLIVVGNVIREANPEAAEMRRRGLPFVSMAEAVRRFAIGSRHSIVVAGTHGKTTTTALAAHTLRSLGADPGFLIGGIARDFESNFHLGSGEHFVIEGDEYDTAYFDKTPKFFKYRPHTLLLGREAGTELFHHFGHRKHARHLAAFRVDDLNQCADLYFGLVEDHHAEDGALGQRDLGFRDLAFEHRHAFALRTRQPARARADGVRTGCQALVQESTGGIGRE